MIRGFSSFLLLALLCSAGPVLADDATLATFWPLFDYRASPAADYQSLHLLGPLVKYESKADETEYAVRPLFDRSVVEQGFSTTEVLDPVSRYKR